MGDGIGWVGDGLGGCGMEMEMSLAVDKGVEL